MKNLIEKFPFYYIILVFIGYAEFYTFYFHFDIEIHKYLTFSETIFSFLPLSFQMLLVIIVIIILTPTKKLKNARESLEKGEIPYNLFFSTKILFDKKRKNKVSIRLFKFVAFIELFLIFLIGVVLLTIIYFVIENFFISSPRFYDNRIMLAMIWIVLIVMIIPFSLYIKQQFDNLRLKIESDIRIFLFSLYFVGIITVSNYYKADRIKSGYPNEYVSFEFENKIYKSDNCLVYVGMTENYLFLRDIKEKRNIIFPRERIGKLEMIKTKYKNNNNL
jgi:hypothetical protein